MEQRSVRRGRKADKALPIHLRGLSLSDQQLSMIPRAGHAPQRICRLALRQFAGT